MAALASFRVGVVVLAIVVGIAQGPATAQENPGWITPEGFRGMTPSRVMLTLRTDGVPVFGHGQFRAGDKVIWQFPDGTCLSRRWQAVAGAIC